MRKAEERNNEGLGEDEGLPGASFVGSGDGLGGQIGPHKLLSVQAQLGLRIPPPPFQDIPRYQTY